MMRWLLPVTVPAVLTLLSAPAIAATIANPVATFSGLDKITGRITRFDVYIDETVQFGALQITPRACYTRPPTETQRTTVFLEVDQVSLQRTVKRIFTGWMFADSPALNAIDHAVYDIWLIDCRQSSEVPPPSLREQPGAAQAAQQPAVPEPQAGAETTGSIPEPAAEATPIPAPIPDQPADTPSFTTLPAQPLGDTFSPVTAP